MMEEYFYYINKAPYNNATQTLSKWPVITKLKRNKLPISFKFEDSNENEGPFNSLFELKKKSRILAEVKLQKLRSRILKSSNIKEISTIILTEKDSSYEKTFIDSFAHITIGKISKRKIKGIHFNNPETIRIVEKTNIDELTGVYSARIEKFDENTGQWLEKKEVTTFFPDNWSIHKLFHECHFAYENKKQSTEKVFFSRTRSGILVKFIIDKENNIITLYPVIEQIE